MYGKYCCTYVFLKLVFKQSSRNNLTKVSLFSNRLFGELTVETLLSCINNFYNHRQSNNPFVMCVNIINLKLVVNVSGPETITLNSRDIKVDYFQRNLFEFNANITVDYGLKRKKHSDIFFVFSIHFYLRYNLKKKLYFK